MAIIGNNTDIVDSNNLDNNILELGVNSSYTYTAAANQEVWKVWLYESGAINSKDISIAVYDITSSEVNATLVASDVVTTTNSANGWRSTVLSAPVALTEGNTYAVAALNATGGTLTFIGSGWLSGDPVRTQTTSTLPATLAATTTTARVVAAYAETRDATSGSTIETTSVNGGSTIADGDTNTAIVGIDYHATTNVVTISPDTNIANANAVVQTVTTNSTTSITIPTVELPTGSSSNDPVYLFVNDGTNTADAFSVSITPITTSAITILLTDDGLDTGTVVVCTSTLGFNFGLTFDAYRQATPSTKETATSVVLVDAGDTATPKFTVTFPNGAIGANDTYKYSYDATAGDIQEATNGQPLASFTDKSGTVCT